MALNIYIVKEVEGNHKDISNAEGRSIGMNEDDLKGITFSQELRLETLSILEIVNHDVYEYQEFNGDAVKRFAEFVFDPRLKAIFYKAYSKGYSLVIC